MVERLNDLLFHPTTNKQYRHVHFFKAILFIGVIALISYFVPIVDLIRYDGVSTADKTELETMFNIDFSKVNELPDCALNDGTLSCDEPDNYTYFERGAYQLQFVFDQNEQFDIDDSRLYVVFAEDRIKLATEGNALSFGYDVLPSSWQQFDLKEIKNSDTPEEALLIEFNSGVNQIIDQFLWFGVLIMMAFAYFLTLFETLFFSFLFYILSRRFGYSFIEVFKVTAFTQTFPAILGLMMILSGIGGLSSIVVMTLTFIYLSKALLPKISRVE